MRALQLRGPLLSLLAAACGGGMGGDPATGSSSGAGGSPDTSIQPPPPGPAHAGDGPGGVFAMSRLFLGDTDRMGQPSADAWRTYGFDLDHRASTAASVDLC